MRDIKDPWSSRRKRNKNKSTWLLFLIASTCQQIHTVCGSPDPNSLFRVQLCAHHGLDMWLFRDGVLVQQRKSGVPSVFQPSYTDSNQPLSFNDFLLPMTPSDACGFLPTATDLTAQSTTYTFVGRRRADTPDAPLSVRLSSSEGAVSGTNWVCSALSDNDPLDNAIALGSSGPDWTSAVFNDTSWTRAAAVKASSVSVRYQRAVIDADVCAFAMPDIVKPIWLRDVNTQLTHDNTTSDIICRYSFAPDRVVPADLSMPVHIYAPVPVGAASPLVSLQFDISTAPQARAPNTADHIPGLCAIGSTQLTAMLVDPSASGAVISTSPTLTDPTDPSSAPMFVPGIQGSALVDLNMAKSYRSRATVPLTVAAGLPMTVSMWVHVSGTSLTTPSVASNTFLVGDCSPDTDGLSALLSPSEFAAELTTAMGCSWGLAVVNNVDGSIQTFAFAITNSATQPLVTLLSPTKFALRAWTPFALVLDATTSSIALYVQGHLDSTSFDLAELVSPLGASGILGIFSSGESTTLDTVTAVDDMRYFETALTAAQLFELAQLPASASPRPTRVTHAELDMSARVLRLTTSGKIDVSQWSQPYTTKVKLHLRTTTDSSTTTSSILVPSSISLTPSYAYTTSHTGAFNSTQQHQQYTIAIAVSNNQWDQVSTAIERVTSAAPVATSIQVSRLGTRSSWTDASTACASNGRALCTRAHLCEDVTFSIDGGALLTELSSSGGHSWGLRSSAVLLPVGDMQGAWVDTAQCIFSSVDLFKTNDAEATIIACCQTDVTPPDIGSSDTQITATSVHVSVIDAFDTSANAVESGAVPLNIIQDTTSGVLVPTVGNTGSVQPPVVETAALDCDQGVVHLVLDVPVRVSDSAQVLTPGATSALNVEYQGTSGTETVELVVETSSSTTSNTWSHDILLFASDSAAYTALIEGACMDPSAALDIAVGALETKSLGGDETTESGVVNELQRVILRKSLLLVDYYPKELLTVQQSTTGFEAGSSNYNQEFVTLPTLTLVFNQRVSAPSLSVVRLVESQSGVTVLTGNFLGNTVDNTLVLDRPQILRQSSGNRLRRGVQYNVHVSHAGLVGELEISMGHEVTTSATGSTKSNVCASAVADSLGPFVLVSQLNLHSKANGMYRATSARDGRLVLGQCGDSSRQQANTHTFTHHSSISFSSIRPSSNSEARHAILESTPFVIGASIATSSINAGQATRLSGNVRGVRDASSTQASASPDLFECPEAFSGSVLTLPSSGEFNAFVGIQVEVRQLDNATASWQVLWSAPMEAEAWMSIDEDLEATMISKGLITNDKPMLARVRVYQWGVGFVEVQDLALSSVCAASSTYPDMNDFESNDIIIQALNANKDVDQHLRLDIEHRRRLSANQVFINVGDSISGMNCKRGSESLRFALEFTQSFAGSDVSTPAFLLRGLFSSNTTASLDVQVYSQSNSRTQLGSLQMNLPVNGTSMVVREWIELKMTHVMYDVEQHDEVSAVEVIISAIPHDTAACTLLTAESVDIRVAQGPAVNLADMISANECQTPASLYAAGLTDTTTDSLFWHVSRSVNSSAFVSTGGTVVETYMPSTAYSCASPETTSAASSDSVCFVDRTQFASTLPVITISLGSRTLLSALWISGSITHVAVAYVPVGQVDNLDLTRNDLKWSDGTTAQLSTQTLGFAPILTMAELAAGVHVVALENVEAQALLVFPVQWLDDQPSVNTVEVFACLAPQNVSNNTSNEEATCVDIEKDGDMENNVLEWTVSGLAKNISSTMVRRKAEVVRAALTDIFSTCSNAVVVGNAMPDCRMTPIVPVFMDGNNALVATIDGVNSGAVSHGCMPIHDPTLLGELHVVDTHVLQVTSDNIGGSDTFWQLALRTNDNTLVVHEMTLAQTQDTISGTPISNILRNVSSESVVWGGGVGQVDASVTMGHVLVALVGGDLVRFVPGSRNVVAAVVLESQLLALPTAPTWMLHAGPGLVALIWASQPSVVQIVQVFASGETEDSISGTAPTLAVQEQRMYIVELDLGESNESQVWSTASHAPSGTVVLGVRGGVRWWHARGGGGAVSLRESTKQLRFADWELDADQGVVSVAVLQVTKGSHIFSYVATTEGWLVVVDLATGELVQVVNPVVEWAAESLSVTMIRVIRSGEGGRVPVLAVTSGAKLLIIEINTATGLMQLRNSLLMVIHDPLSAYVVDIHTIANFGVVISFADGRVQVIDMCDVMSATERKDVCEASSSLESLWLTHCQTDLQCFVGKCLPTALVPSSALEDNVAAPKPCDDGDESSWADTCQYGGSQRCVGATPLFSVSLCGGGVPCSPLRPDFRMDSTSIGRTVGLETTTTFRSVVITTNTISVYDSQSQVVLARVHVEDILEDKETGSVFVPELSVLADADGDGHFDIVATVKCQGSIGGSDSIVVLLWDVVEQTLGGSHWVSSSFSLQVNAQATWTVHARGAASPSITMFDTDDHNSVEVQAGTAADNDMHIRFSALLEVSVDGLDVLPTTNSADRQVHVLHGVTEWEMLVRVPSVLMTDGVDGIGNAEFNVNVQHTLDNAMPVDMLGASLSLRVASADDTIFGEFGTPSSLNDTRWECGGHDFPFSIARQGPATMLDGSGPLYVEAMPRADLNAQSWQLSCFYNGSDSNNNTNSLRRQELADLAVADREVMLNAVGSAAVDVNGDGRADLVMVGQTLLQTWVTNSITSGGSFERGDMFEFEPQLLVLAGTDTLMNSVARAFAVADIDGDGLADVVVAMSDASSAALRTVAVLGLDTSTTNAPWTEALVTDPPPGAVVMLLAAAVDAVGASVQANIIEFGTVESPTTTNITTTFVRVLRKTNATSGVGVWEVAESLTWDVDVSTSTVAAVTDAEAADLDGDGDVDILVAAGGRVYLLRNMMFDSIGAGGAVSTQLSFVVEETQFSDCNEGVLGLQLLDIDSNGKWDLMCTTTAMPYGVVSMIGYGNVPKAFHPASPVFLVRYEE